MAQSRPTRASFRGSDCVVLLSGGMDSAACVDFYRRQHFEVRGLHLGYGQAAARQEGVAAAAVARHYGIPLTVIQLRGARPKSDGELPGRNAVLLFAALMEVGSVPAILTLGVHSGTPYYDCSPNFLAAAQGIVDGQCGGRVRVAAPFLEWTKEHIWEYCLEHQVPLSLTYSCERGLEQPCGVCLSCRDREALHVC